MSERNTVNMSTVKFVLALMGSGAFGGGSSIAAMRSIQAVQEQKIVGLEARIERKTDRDTRRFERIEQKLDAILSEVRRDR